MNNRFVITWERDGVVKSTARRGLTELCEFVRNCNAYERKILSILPDELES